MHLYIAARGITPQLDKWENLMLSTPLQYEYGKMHGEVAKGQKMMSYWQLSMRPVRLYEVVFPEPELNKVMNMIKPEKSWNPGYNKYVWAMRKALGLKEVPQLIQEKGYEWYDRNKQGVNVTGIGVKKDKWENGIEQI